MIDDEKPQPRTKFATSEAKRVWGTFGEKRIPVVLNLITKALEIVTASKVFSTSGAEGYSSIGEDGRVTMIYNKSSSRVRQKFTIAHELGHVVLEHIGIGGGSPEHSSKIREKEADLFANELLIPSSDLKTYLKDGNKTLEDVISRYEVSRNVAVISIEKNRLLMKLKV